MDGGRETRVWRTTLTASSALTTAVLPLFLLGAFSDAVRRDLGIDEAAIGAAVTVLFVAASVAAAPAGRWSERVGGARALQVGVALSGLATAALGAFARDWWHLAVALAVVGGAVGLIDTGAARVFAQRIPVAGQGTAFGVKEASVPAASLVAGLTLPTVAAVLGWRGVFVAALALAAVVLALLPRGAGTVRRGPNGLGAGRADGAPAGGSRTDGVSTDGVGPDGVGADGVGADGVGADGVGTDGLSGDGADLDCAGAVGADGADRGGRGGHDSALVRFAFAAGLGTGAATAAATFLAPAATARGLGTGAAGLVLSVASVASITVRVLAGRWADDDRRSPARAVTVLLFVGAAGATVLAIPAGGAAVAVAGAVLLLGGGWGWTGLAFLTAVRARPAAPAAAAGVVLAGLSAGGAVGPLAFGAVAARVSYPAAWALAAIALGAAAAAAATVRDRPTPADSG